MSEPTRTPHQASRRDFLQFLTALGIYVGCTACQKAIPLGGSPTPILKYDFSRLSFCGIDCERSCPEKAYPDTCDGCKSPTAKCAPYCCTCPVRQCAGNKGVLTCAHCDKFQACDQETWKTYPVLRRQVEGLRAELQDQP